jgi:hypothetical protein
MPKYYSLKDWDMCSMMFGRTSVIFSHQRIRVPSCSQIDRNPILNLVHIYIEVPPEVCTNRGFRGGSGACRPVGTFWYFSKNDIKYGTVYAGVDAVEQARTCAGSSAAMLQEFESWLYPKI